MRFIRDASRRHQGTRGLGLAGRQAGAASNVGTDFATLVDVAAGKPHKNVTTADGAMRSGFSSGGTALYVANAKAASISVVDPQTRKIAQAAPREDPHGVADRR